MKTGDTSVCSTAECTILSPIQLKPPRLLCFAILFIPPALLTQPRLEGATDAPHNVDDRIKRERVVGNERGRGAKRMEREMEQEEKRPGREDKPCLLCLDISL